MSEIIHMSQYFCTRDMTTIPLNDWPYCPIVDVKLPCKIKLTIDSSNTNSTQYIKKYSYLDKQKTCLVLTNTNQVLLRWRHDEALILPSCIENMKMRIYASAFYANLVACFQLNHSVRIFIITRKIFSNIYSRSPHA